MLDMHTHSTLSHDGENDMREMVEHAFKSGLKVIASTEHIDLNVYYSSKYKNNILIPRGHKEIRKLKEEYADKIKLIYGVEFAQSVHDKAFAKEIIDEYQFDYVLGSVHAVREISDFYYLDYNELDNHDLMTKFFNETLEMVEWGEIDAVAHLTYPLRYIVGRCKIDFKLSTFDNKIREIFKVMVAKNIALELNTCGMRLDNYNRPDPDFGYFELYKEMGGDMVTIGSDAHNKQFIGCDIPAALKKLKEIGFDRVTYFEKRKPFYLDI
ncbi:MAG: histidinol-phosphatase HisJ family protein [Oscillospiraceae bacterium]|nr:histidinol-phosphatase HisJ family protein [Oscillospiraceae bacterium]